MCPATHAQVASALAREGEVLDGDSSGRVVKNVFYSALNGVGGYAFRIQMDDAGEDKDYYWGNTTGGAGTVLHNESTIGDYSQTALSFFGISDSGTLGYRARYDNAATGEAGLWGPWRDSDLLLPGGALIPGVPGNYSLRIDHTSITHSGVVYWETAYSSVPNGAKVGDAIFFGDSSAVLKTGDILGGVTEVVSDNITVARFSAQGSNYIAKVELATGVNNQYAVVSNGAVLTAGGGLLREGAVVSSGAGGQAGELFEDFDQTFVTESGEVLITGDTDGNASLDEFLMVNGQILFREGGDLDGATLIGTIESGFMNEDGDWGVVWDVEDGAGGSLEALIVNGDLLMLAGDEVDWNNDGLVNSLDQNASIVNFTAGSFGLSLSDRDANGDLQLLFLADVDVGGTIREGGFSFTYSAVPEPASGLLTAFAFLPGPVRKIV